MPTLTPELEPELVPIKSLTPDPENTQDHPEANLDAIEASYRRFGQRKPLVVTPDYVVRAGNGQLQVARDRLGWQELWVTVFDGTPEEARAFAINDNRSAALAEWDTAALAEQLAALDSDLVDAAGFTPDAARLVIEAADQPGTEPRSKHGPTSFAGQTPGVDLATRAEHYGDKPTRTIYFEVPKELFDWLVERLSEYRAEHDLRGNDRALLEMVAEATGTQAPAEPAAEAQ